MKTIHGVSFDQTAADLQKIARDLLIKASNQKLTMATAESCTGGLVASLLTDVEGVSSAFECGFVTYADEAKCELLGVDPETVKSAGAVSKETAVAMARGALRRSRADVVIAITGFAGPAGPRDEEGLVHFACARRGQFLWCHEEHFGAIGRDAVRTRSVKISLSMLLDAVG